jgi:hypothetical protein
MLFEELYGWKSDIYRGSASRMAFEDEEKKFAEKKKSEYACLSRKAADMRRIIGIRHIDSQCE